MSAVDSTAISHGEVDFLPLAEAPDELLDEFYANLLEKTFVADELETLENIRKGLRGNAGGVLVLVDASVAGGLIYEHYVQGSVQLLGYLVVKPALRGMGLGAKLLQSALAMSDSQLALAEIEDPRYWPTSPSNDPVARLRFWAREGCKFLPLPYVQPLLPGRHRRVRHLLLIAVPRNGVALPESVPGRLVGDFLREYYMASKDSVSDDDAEIGELLDLCSVEHLPLLPLDRLDAADGYIAGRSRPS